MLTTERTLFENVTSCFSLIIFRLLQVIWLANCVLVTIKNSLEIGSAHWKFYGLVLMSKTQIGSSKFHVVDKTTTAVICIKTWNSRSKRAKVLCFVVKYANILFPCSGGGGGGRLIFLWIVNLFIGWLTCWFLISQLFLRNWLVWKALN